MPEKFLTVETSFGPNLSERMLHSLEKNVGEAMNLAGEVVAAEAKANHDYKDRTGALTNSIQSDGARGSFRGRDLSVTVAAGEPYGIYVAEGTRPHKIKPRHRKALRWPVEGGFQFAKVVNHPGTPAFPFLEDAWEAKMHEIGEEMNAAVDLCFEEAFDRTARFR